MGRDNGDHGGYLQVVKVKSVKTTSHRKPLTVQVGKKRGVWDGEGINFPRNMGETDLHGRPASSLPDMALDAPGAGYTDLAGKN